MYLCIYIYIYISISISISIYIYLYTSTYPPTYLPPSLRTYLVEEFSLRLRFDPFQFDLLQPLHIDRRIRDIRRIYT